MTTEESNVGGQKEKVRIGGCVVVWLSESCVLCVCVCVHMCTCCFVSMLFVLVCTVVSDPSVVMWYYICHCVLNRVLR